MYAGQIRVRDKIRVSLKTLLTASHIVIWLLKKIFSHFQCENSVTLISNCTETVKKFGY
jgi:hypothetical protein